MLRYAYRQACNGKKSSLAVDGFRAHEEQLLMQLYEDLFSNNYRPGKSTFFVIHDPVQREICAAPFRDRIVHHFVSTYLEAIFDPRFIADSYGARSGKGTHYGVAKTLHHIRQCTNNNTKSCRIMKLDIEGFFMNIDQETLTRMIYQTLCTYTYNPRRHHNSLPRYLWKWLQTIISYVPTSNYRIKWTLRDWEWLPSKKSLFHRSLGKWLPLGNLTSQLFANIYLDPLDQYIKHVLKVKYYGRYMDDMVLIHEDKDFLLDVKEKVKIYLEEYLKLSLHPKKNYLQQSHKGVPFLGYHIYPWWCLLGKRTIKNQWRKTYEWNNRKPVSLEKIQASVNSYLGMARHGKNFHLRKQMIHKLKPHISNELQWAKSYTKLSYRVKKVKKKKWTRKKSSEHFAVSTTPLLFYSYLLPHALLATSYL